MVSQNNFNLKSLKILTRLLKKKYVNLIFNL
jgi:hypothetical protein